MGDNEDCACQLPNLIAVDYPWQSKLRIDWTPNPNFHYEFFIEYHNGTESSMSLTPVTTPFTNPKLKFIVGCFENMNYGTSINDNMFFAPNATNDIQIYFRPSDYSFIISGALWRINRAGILLCANKNRGNFTEDNIMARGNSPASTIFPNPANEQLNVKFDSERNKTIDILVYNNLGTTAIFPNY